MSISKKILKSKPVCKVTFTVAKEMANGAERVDLLGEFNNWNTAEPVVMNKFKNGNFKVTLDLPVGKDFQFKYLINGQTWVNDDAADHYVNSGLGAETNSVVSL